MHNDFLENAVNALNSYILVSKQQSQLQEKNYIMSEMFLEIEEVEKLCSPFREIFIETGCFFIVRKYYFSNNKIEYEARFLRFGCRIVCRSDNLEDLKRQFIAQANELFQ